jgi:hypothetical protein
MSLPNNTSAISIIDEGAPVVGVSLVTIELDCGGTYLVWRVLTCPYCGDQHDHGTGPIGTKPTDYLGGRMSHCYPGGEYRLVPSGVLTRNRIPIPSNIRADVWDKSYGFCWYCGIKMHPFRNFHVDHVVPVSNGGTNDMENLVPSCQACNSRKKDKSMESLRVFMADGVFWFEKK